MGYNKEDVNDYLEDMNLRFAAIEDDYKKIIYSQKQTIETMEFKTDDYDHLREELASATSKLAERENWLDDNKIKFEEYERLLAVLNEKIEQYVAKENDSGLNLSRENAELIKYKKILEDKLAGRESYIENLNNELKALKNSGVVSKETEEKAHMYDDMSRQLGNMLLLANNNSEKLIAEASVKAELIIEEANAFAEKIKADAESKAELIDAESHEKCKTMLSAVNDKLFELAEDYIRVYSEYLWQVQDDFDNIINGLRIKSGEVKLKVEKMGEAVGEELDIEFKRIIKEIVDEEI